MRIVIREQVDELPVQFPPSGRVAAVARCVIIEPRDHCLRLAVRVFRKPAVMSRAAPAPLGGGFAPFRDLRSQGLFRGLSAERRKRVEEAARGGVITFALGLQPREERASPPRGFDPSHAGRRRLGRSVVKEAVGEPVTRMRFPVGACGGPLRVVNGCGVPLAAGEKFSLQTIDLGGQCHRDGRGTLVSPGEMALLRCFHRLAQPDVASSAGRSKVGSTTSSRRTISSAGA